MIIYLAGGMKDGWQDRAAVHLAGHELLDPRSWSTPDPAEYTARDLEAVRQADAILAHMCSANPSGFGLSVELGYAYALGKRIVFCDEIGGDWRSGYFGMHRQMATVVCSSLEEAAKAHLMAETLDMFDEVLGAATTPRFVIFSSYGNDSVALIQWAHDEGLTGIVVVYSNTGWAAKWWGDRVGKMEAWVRSLGYRTAQTQSIGFRELARKKKAFPTQQFQWCSHALKIAPAEVWLTENDPERRAVCLVGVRREEGQDRANFPAFLLNSGSHGGRVMIAPMVEWTAEQRDGYLAKAGFDPLPHRSMECSPCVNSNKKDFRAMEEDDIVKGEEAENELTAEFGLTANGKPRTLFRPHRHMGAVGIREVVKWAKSERGKYQLPETTEPEDTAVEGGCVSGWCGI